MNTLKTPEQVAALLWTHSESIVDCRKRTRVAAAIRADRIAMLREINRRAEADMLNGNPITGAHHRAIEAIRKEVE